MNIFEGYVGIRLWDGQLVDDVIFSLLLFLFIVFSFVFRTNFQLFVKMLKDAFLVKERQNLFDDVIGKSIFFFRNFMTFQVLFLSSIALIAVWYFCTKVWFICITLSRQVLYGIEHQKVAGITTEACIREVPVFRHCREVWS